MIIDDPTKRRTSTLVRAICFPHEDELLISRVQDVLEGWATTQTTPSPDALTATLAAWYPHIAVSIREPIAELWGTDEPTWYVYRDGSLLSSRDDGVDGSGPADD